MVAAVEVLDALPEAEVAGVLRPVVAAVEVLDALSVAEQDVPRAEAEVAGVLQPAVAAAVLPDARREAAGAMGVLQPAVVPQAGLRQVAETLLWASRGEFRRGAPKEA